MLLILTDSFEEESINPLGLLVAALPPTIVAILAFQYDTADSLQTPLVLEVQCTALLACERLYGVVFIDWGQSLSCCA